MSKSQFNDSITRLLTERLKRFHDKRLDLVTCVEVYQTIFDTLVDVFQTSGINITNEAMNYIAQQYYDSVVINGTDELNPNIFTQRSKVENVETKELTLMAMLFSGTDFVIPLIHEVKKRS